MTVTRSMSDTLLRRWKLHWRLVEFLMFMMVIGPPLAIIFQSTDASFGNREVAVFINWIGTVICPQLDYRPVINGIAYAVCYRCGAAIVGLVAARWLHRQGGAMREWSGLARLGFLGLNLLWLNIDLHYTHIGLWDANIPLMLGHGVIYGLSVGGVLFSVLLAVDSWLERPHSTYSPSRADATSAAIASPIGSIK